MDAKQQRYGEADLPALFAGGTKLVAMKGKKVHAFDLGSARKLDPELTRAVLGPTGNLRAPTLRVGKTWLVGFSEDEYAARFG